MGKDKNINFLLAFCFLFLVLKIFALYKTELGLYGDEAQYWAWSKNLSWGYFSKPPLIAFLIRLFTEIFGDGFFAIKLFPVIFYIFTSITVYFVAKILFNKKVAAVSGITFFLLPGVSLSSFLISTDVPLLLFWSLALYFSYRLIKSPNIIFALILGISIGIGFLAKYAMVYYFICTAFYAFIDRSFFIHLLNNKKVYSFVFLVFLIIVFPNLYWNIKNSWLTFGHTFDNASLKSFGFEPKEFLNFIFTQLLIVGPVFSLFFLRFFKEFFKLSASFAFLISYSFPVLFIVSAESILVRAHGNWAAVSFVSLTILFVAVASSKNNKILHLNNIVNLLVGIVFFCLIMAESNIKIFDQLKGYENFSKIIVRYSNEEKIKNIVIEDRMLYSLMAYHLRNSDFNFYTPKNPLSSIGHHFQINKGLSKNNKEKFIYLGDPDSLNYILKPNKINILESADINQKINNIKIYKYVFD